MQPVVPVHGGGGAWSSLVQHMQREAAGLWENAVSYRLISLLLFASALILLLLSSSMPPSQRHPAGLQMDSMLSTAAALDNHPGQLLGGRRKDLAQNPVLALAMAARDSVNRGVVGGTGRPGDDGEVNGSVILPKVVRKGSGKHKTVIAMSQSQDTPEMSSSLHSSRGRPGAISDGSEAGHTPSISEAQGSQQLLNQEKLSQMQELNKGTGAGESATGQEKLPQGKDKEEERTEMEKVEQRLKKQRKYRAQEKSRKERQRSWDRRSKSAQAGAGGVEVVHGGVGRGDFSDDPTLAQKRKPLDAHCDLWSGRWVYDESYPLWEAESCNFGLRCTHLGRKDTHYTHFRWQPDECDLPRFNASEVRERLWGKRVIVIGDSLGRNHFESMLCLLSSGIPNAHQVVQEISGGANRPRVDWRVYRFQGYNFTMEYYVSHFLVLQHSLPKNVEFPKEVTSFLNASAIDDCAPRMEKATEDLGLQGLHRILVLNAGHWFNVDKTYNQGVYFLRDGKVDTSLSLVDGFVSSMRTVAKWMQEQQQKDNATILWRSYSPIHFTGGAWNGGGHCRAQWPLPANVSADTFHQTRQENKYVDDTEAMAEAAMVVMKESNIPVMDITPLSSIRPDGHPSKYANAANRGQDCSHWCLPGVPDTWNELMFAYLKVNSVL